MRLRFILHIGPHKTGTTSIQRMLFSQSSQGDSTFAYPFSGPESLGQHAFALAASKPRDPAFSEMLAALKSVNKTCVLSSEELCYIPRSAMQLLRNKLTKSDFTIVYYQRNPLELLYSWWQETIKHGATHTLLEFAFSCVVRPSHLHLLVPDALLSAWASVFSRESIRIFLFDRIPDVASQFASELLNIISPVGVSEVSNKSYDYVDCELMRFWNAQGFRGADIIQLSNYDEMRQMFIDKSAPFAASFSLNYDVGEFQEIENSMILNWSDRIDGFSGDRLFEIRDRSYCYIHADVWLAIPGLIEDMRSYALENLDRHR